MQRSVFETFASLLKQGKKEVLAAGLKGQSAVRVSIDKPGVSANIETLYNVAIQKALEIGYQLEWALTLEQGKEAKPVSAVQKEHLTLNLSIFSIADMSEAETTHYNTKFIQRIRENCLRDLSELFDLYLNGIYRTASLIIKDDKPINTAYTQRIRKFDRLPVEKKLEKLRALDFVTRYKDALVSLAIARNIYTHTDPILSPPSIEHFENEVIWYRHTVKFKEVETGKMIEIEDMPKLFGRDSHPEMQITYFDPKRRQSRILDDKGRLILTDEDLREICFLYISCFELYHNQMIRFSMKHNLPVKMIEEYGLRPQQQIVFVSEDEPSEDPNVLGP